MKKLVLSLIMASLIIGSFAACNTQENTQETGSEVISNSEQDNSQSNIGLETTQQEEKTYVGTYEYVESTDDNNESTATYRIALNSDGTFSMNIETYDSWRDEDALWKLYEATGTYAEEDAEWILLTCDKIVNNYRDTGESEESLSAESGNTLYVAIKDDNTLLVESGDWKEQGEKPSLDDMIECTRTN